MIPSACSSRKAAAIKPLGVEREAKPVMPDDLHEIAAPAPENEEIASMGIAVEAFLNLQRQALHAAAHISMAGREPDPHARGDRDHPSARSVAVTRDGGAEAYRPYPA